MLTFAISPLVLIFFVVACVFVYTAIRFLLDLVVRIVGGVLFAFLVRKLTCQHKRRNSVYSKISEATSKNPKSSS